MTRAIRAVGLDFDGVVVESAKIKTDAFRHLFAHVPEHLPAIVALHQKYGGISRHRKFEMIPVDILKRPLDDAERKRLADGFARFVFEGVVACSMVPGAQAFLETWSSTLPLFLISGTPETELIEIVERRNLGQYLTEVHGSPADKASIITDILNQHNLQPSEMIYVGDASSDEIAANKAGVPFIGIASNMIGSFKNPVDILPNLNDLGRVIREWPKQ